MTDITEKYCSFCGKKADNCFAIVKAESCSICDTCIDNARDLLGQYRLQNNNGEIQDACEPEGPDSRSLN